MTERGENVMTEKENKASKVMRLKRIEGQIRGIQQMIEDDKYCIDIINQITAAKKALEQVALLVMKGHMQSCVTDAIRSKKGDDLIDELIGSVDKFIR